MSNYLVLSEGNRPTEYGVKRIMRIFAEKKNCEFRELLIEKVTKENLEWADVVLAIRADSPLFFSILLQAKNSGVFTMFFLDDDLKDISKDSYRYQRRNTWLLKCLKLCNVLIAANPLLAEEYEPYLAVQRSIIMHNTVECDKLLFHEAGKRVSIVYAASEGHTEYFEKLISPILPSLFEKYKESISFTCIGIRPNISVDSDVHDIQFIPNMEVEKYKEYMKKECFDIGIAPLEETHFSARKYFNKYIEYARYGIAGIYSKVMPYTMVVEDGVNGLLVQNDSIEWNMKLCDLIEDEQKRKSIVINAQNHLKNHHDMEMVLNKLDDDIPEIRGYRKERRGRISVFHLILFSARNRIFLVDELRYKVSFVLRNRGIKGLLMRIVP